MLFIHTSSLVTPSSPVTTANLNYMSVSVSHLLMKVSKVTPERLSIVSFLAILCTKLNHFSFHNLIETPAVILHQGLLSLYVTHCIHTHGLYQRNCSGTYYADAAKKSSSSDLLLNRWDVHVIV